MTGGGWRVWLAFEEGSSVTTGSSRLTSEYWRGLADACRGSDGEIDGDQFGSWVDLIVGRGHLWADA